MSYQLLQNCLLSFILSFMVFHVHRNHNYGLSGTVEEWGREREPRPTSVFTQILSSVVHRLLLSVCFTSTETVWFIRDGRRMALGMRV